MKAVNSLHQQAHQECNPYKAQLDESTARPKVYVVMHIPSYEQDVWFAFRVSVVPVEMFANTDVDDIMKNAKFPMRTLCVSDLGIAGMEFKNINNTDVPNTGDIPTLTKALANITNDMRRVAEEEYKDMDKKRLCDIMKTIDTQGLILYCNPNADKAQLWIGYLQRSMIQSMWEDMCKDCGEYAGDEKKRKFV